jgi:hypothetical protein
MTNLQAKVILILPLGRVALTCIWIPILAKQGIICGCYSALAVPSMPGSRLAWRFFLNVTVLCYCWWREWWSCRRPSRQVLICRATSPDILQGSPCRRGFDTSPDCSHTLQFAIPRSDACIDMTAMEEYMRDQSRGKTCTFCERVSMEAKDRLRG